MKNNRSSNVTYIIDGNNFVCEETNVIPPSCEHMVDFSRRIDQWLERDREHEVHLVFDPGARNCDFESVCAKIHKADGEKADALILRLARKIRKEHPNRVVRIISNEMGNEFALLRSEHFDQKNNSYLRRKISPKYEKDDAIAKGNFDDLEVAFGMATENKTEKEDYSYYRHIWRFEDSSSSLEIRLHSIKALRHFRIDSVVWHLQKWLENETELKIRKCILEVLLEILDNYQTDQTFQALENSLEELFYEESDPRIKELADTLLGKLSTRSC